MTLLGSAVPVSVVTVATVGAAGATVSTVTLTVLEVELLPAASVSTTRNW